MGANMCKCSKLPTTVSHFNFSFCWKMIFHANCSANIAIVLGMLVTLRITLAFNFQYYVSKNVCVCVVRATTTTTVMLYPNTECIMACLYNMYTTIEHLIN